MASVFPSWQSAPTSTEALRLVANSGFDPRRDLVVEGAASSPGNAPTAGGTARFSWLGDSSARIDVRSNGGMVLVRVPFAPGWHATVDGRRAPVLPADFVDQAIPVPAGHHVVQLSYEDPSVVQGIAISIAALLLILLAGEVMHRHRRRTRAGEQVDGATSRQASADGP
jgi:hypothetical protein